MNKELKIGDTVQKLSIPTRKLISEWKIDSETKAESRSGHVRFKKKVRDGNIVTRLGAGKYEIYLLKTEQ